MIEKIASSIALLMSMVLIGAVIMGGATVAVVGVTAPVWVVAKLIGG